MSIPWDTLDNTINPQFLLLWICAGAALAAVLAAVWLGWKICKEMRE